MTSRTQIINSSRKRVSNLERHPGQGRGHQPNNHGSDNDEENCVPDDRGSEDIDGMEDLNQTVKKLVRYALACEYQRSTIKRTGITERGLSLFHVKKILIRQSLENRSEAQEQLRNCLGMEMVELPVRQKVTLREKKGQLNLSTAQKTKGNSKSSTAYVLKSILPPKYRNTDIMPPPSQKSSSDEAAYMGLYTVIICLISLSADRQIANHQLDKYLKRLNIDRNTGIGTTSELLIRMKKENYLQEYKTQDEEGQNSEWRVGPRGLVEVNNEAIIGFVQMIYGCDAPEDLLQRLHRSLGQQVAND
ncbi:putative mage family protein [Golovinomyces cichoracearum]|uniref:Putative mage family protein n=1 Tax=Golovinomyces cichoracearum TaxID=62708 RepID=A0A420IQ58_9PEZI|nr:putative mage family protein [Golovinomyces cichoracearum]